MTGQDSPRVPKIENRNELPADQRRHYDTIEETRDSVTGPFTVLLNSPEVAGRIGHLGTYLRFDSDLSPADREVAILVTARELDCAYEWAVHESLAKQHGVEDEVIATIASQADVRNLPDLPSIIIRYGRELFRDHRISDDVFGSVKDQLGVKGITELTATMGYYSMISCVLNAFEVVPEDGTSVSS